MTNIDINKLKDSEFKFVELDVYDEFEVIFIINKGEEKINQVYYLMKIPMQNENGREYNTVSLLDERIKMKINPSRLVKPLIYKKLTTTKEERKARYRSYDMKYNCKNKNHSSENPFFNDDENVF